MTANLCCVNGLTVGKGPLMRANIAVLDPPWSFSSNSVDRPGRNARRHYRCMSDAEIAVIPVCDWLEDDALVFVWTTSPMLERSMAVVRQWGRLRYVSQIVWCKDRIGTGFWVRNRHEVVLLYRRGAFPCPRPAPFLDSVIAGQQRQHSRKPDALQDRIDVVWPDARKIEIFARQRRPGWVAVGNEVDRFAVEAAA